MKRELLSAASVAALLVAAVALTACNDNDNNNWADNAPRITFKNVSPVKDFVESGDFEALAVGESTTFSFAAAPGQVLMLAAKVAATNDLFLAPANPGIPLYDANSNPLTGVQSEVLTLWDCGVSSNDEEARPTADGVVGEVTGNAPDGNPYPAASALLEVSLAYDATTSTFTCTLTNTSAQTSLESDLSAGVYAISNVLQGKLVEPTPLFEVGKEADDDLEALATAGNNTPLLQELTADTGIMTTLNGTLVVIYTGDENPLYKLNAVDAGLGLAILAQTGDVVPLAEALSNLGHVKRIFTSDKLLLPGDEIECIYWATEREKVAYALSFGYSNDWFFANGPEIKARNEGSTTSQTLLLDSGTAVSQYPGAGAAQLLFGGTPIPEQNPITQVGNEFPVPPVNQLIQVTMK